jgi:membrane protein
VIFRNTTTPLRQCRNSLTCRDARGIAQCFISDFLLHFLRSENRRSLYVFRGIFLPRETKHDRCAVHFEDIERAVSHTYQDVIRHHALQVAAALAYYFVLSAIPCVIFLSAVIGFIPLPNLFGDILGLMARLLPPDTMQAAYPIVTDIISSRRVTWLSFGMLGTIWIASSAFDAIIEALDIAYDANDNRPIWKTRLLSIGLAAITGSLLLVAFAVNLLGPRFGDWLAARLEISAVFVAIWPFLRWSIAVGFAVLAVEMLYFLAPNVKQRFLATLPGAILSVAAWNALSLGLGIYLRHFAHYNRTYGTLAGLIAFMVWLYWTSFALLVGAELNSELAKVSAEGRVQPKAGPIKSDATDQSISLDRAA